MDPAERVDCSADERLLRSDERVLPESVGQPEPLPPPSPARKRIVGLGATLTGASLLGGIALVVAGGVVLATGGLGTAGLAALLVGILLAGTHWGWVHVAEATADSIEGRRQTDVESRRRDWLKTVKPYMRYEVATSVGDDGSITIVRTRYRPVSSGERCFVFEQATEHEERHSAEESSAVVAERAELLRRQAAADTERERQRFELAADAYETALLSADDEHQRRLARRAASEALSEQINAKLRDPPLIE